MKQADVDKAKYGTDRQDVVRVSIHLFFLYV